MTAGHIKFNWIRYIGFAEDLLETIPKDGDDEVKERCGISRAYYGAFHRAKSYLNEIGISVDINGSDSHKKVISEFKNIGKSNALWRGIGLDLDRLRIQRKKADYYERYFTDIERNRKLRTELELAVEKARCVVERIDEIEEQERYR